MLRIIHSTSGAAAVKYFEEGLQRADYFASKKQTISEWHGKAAHMLGLSGSVQKQAIQHALSDVNNVTMLSRGRVSRGSPLSEEQEAEKFIKTCSLSTAKYWQNPAERTAGVFFFLMPILKISNDSISQGFYIAISEGLSIEKAYKIGLTKVRKQYRGHGYDDLIELWKDGALIEI